MEKLNDLNGGLLKTFEVRIDDFSRYYATFNMLPFKTLELLSQKEEKLMKLRESVDRLREKQSYFELNATKNEISDFVYMLKKADDFYESSKGFLVLREELLEPTKDEIDILHDAYCAGWEDYREVMYYCYKLKGTPITMKQIVGWGPDWLDLSSIH